MEKSDQDHSTKKPHVYRRLLLMTLMSFVIMYLVMFLNVDEISHIYLSITRTYMALLMVAPMAVIMILMMQKMYQNKRLNSIIIGSGIAVFLVALIFLRNQIFITDVQYMKAMIPHHSSAILTSKHANIEDAEVKVLAESIIKSQEEEIRIMKEKIKELK